MNAPPGPPRGWLPGLALASALAVGALGWLAGPGGALRAFERGTAGVSSGIAGGFAPAASAAPLTSLAGTFTDQRGVKRTLAGLRGRPFVASLVYTRCTTVCPRVVAELKRLEREAGATDAPRFVLFSLDPAHDDPGALRAFAAGHGLDPGRWTLLTPEPSALPPLAAALGVARQAGAGGAIAHTAVIALVDSAGVVRGRSVGLAGAPGALAAAWRALR